MNLKAETMSDKKKSLDNLKQDQTDTNEVKGGFRPNHRKTSQGLASDESKYNLKPIVDPKKPEKGHGDKTSTRLFGK